MAAGDDSTGISRLLESTLVGINPNSITDGFSLLIICGLIYMVFILDKDSARFKRLDPIAPSIFTMIGILGTFLGIVVGLSLIHI